MVLAILGVLSAIAVPKFQRSIARQRADAAATRVAADLRFARKRAMQRSTTQSIVFTLAAGNDAYGLPSVPGLNDPTTAYRVPLSAEPYNASLTTVTLGGDLTLIFDGFGVPDSGGTIVLRVGEFVKTITINASTGEPTISP